MKNYKRTHVFAAIDFLKNFSPIFLLTVIRRLFVRPNSLHMFIIYNGIDALILALVIIAAVSQYLTCWYSLSENRLYVRRGLFIKSEYFADKKKLSIVSVTAAPLQRLFNSREINFFTQCRHRKSNHKRIFLYGRESINVLKNLFGGDFKLKYQCRLRYLLLMALTRSDTVSGILLFAASLRRAGQIFGEEYAKFLYEQIDPAEYIIALGVEPITAAIAGSLILAMLFVVLYRLITYGDFSVIENGDTLCCKRGVIWRYVTFVRKSSISFFVEEQSFIMRMLNCVSIRFASDSAAFIKSERNLVVPAADKRFLKKSRNVEGIKIRPPKKAALSYAMLPAGTAALTSAVFCLFLKLNVVNEVTKTLFCAALSVEIFWVMFRLDLPERVGIILYQDKITVKTFSRFKLICAQIPLRKITAVRIEQNPFQRSDNSFHLYLYSGIHRLRIKHLRCDNVILGKLKESFEYGCNMVIKDS